MGAAMQFANQGIDVHLPERTQLLDKDHGYRFTPADGRDWMGSYLRNAACRTL